MKLLISFIAVFIVINVLLTIPPFNGNNSFVKHTGYYYDGLVDIREKFDDNQNEDKYLSILESYYEANNPYQFVHTTNETKGFFHKHGTLNWLSIDDHFQTNLNNGDYIQVLVYGSLREIGPATANIVEITILKSR
ncbi:hypothetical protein ACFQ4N_11580 [Oceanobacillus iheyensis]|uniref:hypothetical protein n=1 Tax=Oceanobacillus iheyensis TaxID=182710 RepID=UPI003630E163